MAVKKKALRSASIPTMAQSDFSNHWHYDGLNQLVNTASVWSSPLSARVHPPSVERPPHFNTSRKHFNKISPESQDILVRCSNDASRSRRPQLTTGVAASGVHAAGCGGQVLSGALESGKPTNAEVEAGWKGESVSTRPTNAQAQLQQLDPSVMSIRLAAPRGRRGRCRA